MQDILLQVNASPYGSERSLTALRMALTFVAMKEECRLKIVLLSDAVALALSGQASGQGPSHGAMLMEAMENGAEVYVCRSCADARGVSVERLLSGVAVTTMPQVAAWTLEADKVVCL